MPIHEQDLEVSILRKRRQQRQWDHNNRHSRWGRYYPSDTGRFQFLSVICLVFDVLLYVCVKACAMFSWSCHYWIIWAGWAGCRIDCCGTNRYMDWLYVSFFRSCNLTREGCLDELSHSM